VHGVIKPRSHLIGNGLFEPHFDDETTAENPEQGSGSFHSRSGLPIRLLRFDKITGVRG
jgi:hypothetical protein